MSSMEKASPQPRTQIDSSVLSDVEVALEARLGRSTLTIGALTALEQGSVITLDCSLADHADLYLNGKCVARGEIVAVGDNFGVRITEIAPE